MTKKSENLLSRRSFIASSIGGAFVLTSVFKGGENVLASSKNGDALPVEGQT